MTAPDPAALRALIAKATPGPWSITLGSGACVMTAIYGDGVMIADCLPDYFLRENIGPPDHRPNMTLIVAAVNALPQLLDELDALKRDRDARNKIDPVTRMHNLCDHLAEQRHESPYDQESWDLQDEAYREKCVELKRAKDELDALRAALTYADNCLWQAGIEPDDPPRSRIRHALGEGRDG